MKALTVYEKHFKLYFSVR